MKEKIAKINETKSLFFEEIKQTNHQPDSLKEKGRKLKAIKLEMKKKLQQTIQIYKGSQETTTSNFIANLYIALYEKKVASN